LAVANYANPGDAIIDTHVGSASSLIACEMEGFKYVGFENDKDYYHDSTKRLEQWRKGRTIDIFKKTEFNKNYEQMKIAI